MPPDRGEVTRNGDSGLLRRLNLAAALRAFFAVPSLSVRELRSVIGVSRPTAEEVLATLLERGRIEEATESELPPGRGAGRPARRYRLAAGAGHVAGLDIGAHKVACVITDLRGTVLASRQQKVEPDLTAGARVAAAVRVAADCSTAAGLDVARLDGAACGVVGMIPVAGGVRDMQSFQPRAGLGVYSLPGFVDLDLSGLLGGLLGRPVVVANDVHMAAVAERWLGAAVDVDDVVYMFAGKRLGTGLLIGGEVHHGRHGLAGEIGSLRLLGWQEAMDRLATASAQHARAAGLPPGADGGELLFAAAADGDADALAVVDTVASALALGAAILVHAVDPQLVVLGGGLSKSGDVIAEPFRRHLETLCVTAPDVALSRLGDESVALGAARHALDALERNLLEVSLG